MHSISEGLDAQANNQFESSPGFSEFFTLATLFLFEILGAFAAGGRLSELLLHKRPHQFRRTRYLVPNHSANQKQLEPCAWRCRYSRISSLWVIFIQRWWCAQLLPDHQLKQNKNIRNFPLRLPLNMSNKRTKDLLFCDPLFTLVSPAALFNVTCKTILSLLQMLTR